MDKNIENPLEYYRLLQEYHQLQESIIKEYNIPTYHFSGDEDITNELKKNENDSPFFFFSSCLPKLVELVKQYQKRIEEVKSDNRQIEIKKKYFQKVLIQIQKENQQSKLQLSRASGINPSSGILDLNENKNFTSNLSSLNNISSNTNGNNSSSNSQQNMLREYIILLKRENKVLQKQINNFRSFLDRSPINLKKSNTNTSIDLKKNEEYLESLVEKSKKKESKILERLKKREIDYTSKKTLFLKKRKKLDELRNLYGYKLEHHNSIISKKKTEKEELKKTLALQMEDLQKLKKEIMVLRETKIVEMENKLKTSQSKELHFLNQISSLERKKSEISSELNNIAKKIKFFKNSYTEKQQFEEARKKANAKKEKFENSEILKSSNILSSDQLENEKKMRIKIEKLESLLECKTEELRELKIESDRRKEKLFYSSSEESKFEELLGKNRELYFKKLQFSSKLSKIEKQIKISSVNLRLQEDLRTRKKNYSNEYVKLSKNIDNTDNSNQEDTDKDKEDENEIESIISLKEKSKSEILKKKKIKILKLKRKLEFLKNENKKFSQKLRNKSTVSDVPEPEILLLDTDRQKIDLEYEEQQISKIKEKKRSLEKNLKSRKNELRKLKIQKEEKLFRFEILSKKINLEKNRVQDEEERMKSLVLKQEKLLKKRSELRVLLDE